MDTPSTNAVNGGGRGSGKFNEVTRLVGELLQEDNQKRVVVLGMTEEQSERLSSHICTEYDFMPIRTEMFRDEHQGFETEFFYIQTLKKVSIGYEFSYPSCYISDAKAPLSSRR